MSGANWLASNNLFCTIWFPHLPVVTRRLGVSKSGRVYVSDMYRQHKRFIAKALAREWERVPVPTTWGLHAVFYDTNETVAYDLDNAMKPIVDAVSMFLGVDDKAHFLVTLWARRVNMLDCESELMPEEFGLWLGLECRYSRKYTREEVKALMPSTLGHK